MKQITEEDLRKLYCDDNFSQIKIAKLYETSPVTICKWMKKFGIKARSAKDMCPTTINLSLQEIDSVWKLYTAGLNRLEIANKLSITEWAVRKIIDGNELNILERRIACNEWHTIPLSYEQEQLILGSLLGDACLLYRKRDNNDCYEFQVGHCVVQKGWLAYKAKILNSNISSYIKDKNSYSAGKVFYTTSYSNKYELQRIHNMCYVDNIKTVSEKWVEKLDAFAIATWFMDDGSSTFGKGCAKESIRAGFATLSFPKEQLKFLQARLLEFGILTTLHKHPDGFGLNIAIRQKSINLFMALIEPYMVECMRYKIKKRANEPNFKFSGKDIKRANGVL